MWKGAQERKLIRKVRMSVRRNRMLEKSRLIRGERLVREQRKIRIY